MSWSGSARRFGAPNDGHAEAKNNQLKNSLAVGVRRYVQPRFQTDAPVIHCIEPNTWRFEGNRETVHVSLSVVENTAAEQASSESVRTTGGMAHREPGRRWTREGGHGSGLGSSALLALGGRQIGPKLPVVVGAKLGARDSAACCSLNPVAVAAWNLLGPVAPLANEIGVYVDEAGKLCSTAGQLNRALNLVGYSITHASYPSGARA